MLHLLLIALFLSPPLLKLRELLRAKVERAAAAAAAAAATGSNTSQFRCAVRDFADASLLTEREDGRWRRGSGLGRAEQVKARRGAGGGIGLRLATERNGREGLARWQCGEGDAKGSDGMSCVPCGRGLDGR
jgi:hypothetical protein